MFLVSIHFHHQFNWYYYLLVIVFHIDSNYFRFVILFICFVLSKWYCGYVWEMRPECVFTYSWFDWNMMKFDKFFGLDWLNKNKKKNMFFFSSFVVIRIHFRSSFDIDIGIVFRRVFISLVNSQQIQNIVFIDYNCNFKTLHTLGQGKMNVEH